MKKLLSVAIVAIASIISSSCMAGHHERTISITNNTDETVDVRDKNDNEISVEPNRSTSMKIRVNEPHGSFPIPSSIMPHGTTITVTDDEGKNSIKVDENTKSITIDKGLELSKDKPSKRNKPSKRKRNKPSKRNKRENRRS